MGTITDLTQALATAKREAKEALVQMEAMAPGEIDKSELFVLADDIIMAGQRFSAVGRRLADSIITDDAKSLVQMD
jgi:hypothetical protein